MTCMRVRFKLWKSIRLPDKRHRSRARNPEVPVVSARSPVSAYGSPLHHGASLGYRGWSDSSLSRLGEERTGSRGGTFSAARFSALESVGPGLERPPGSISRTSPARSLAWPTAAPCTLLGGTAQHSCEI